MSVKDGNPAVEVWIADKQSSISQTIKTGLRTLGVQNFREFDSTSGLRKYLKQMCPDLLIADADFTDGDMNHLFRDIRHGTLGDNPFLPIIATSFQQDASVLRRVLDTGVDGLLLKPVSAASLNRHIQAVTQERKPFVVTTLYIGPDRRKDDARANSARQFTVPNILALKRNGGFAGDKAAQDQIQAALAEINVERLRRGAFEVSFLAALMAQAVEKNTVGRQTKGQMARCLVVLKEIRARSVGTELHQYEKIVAALDAILAGMLENFSADAPPDISKIRGIAANLLGGFFPEKDATALENDVAAAVAGFHKRQKTRPQAVA